LGFNVLGFNVLGALRFWGVLEQATTTQPKLKTATGNHPKNAKQPPQTIQPKIAARTQASRDP
jgi:hypothetical protein